MSDIDEIDWNNENAELRSDELVAQLAKAKPLPEIRSAESVPEFVEQTYRLETELQGPTPRPTLWRGSWFNPKFRAILIGGPALYALLQLISVLPNFLVATQASADLDKAVATVAVYHNKERKGDETYAVLQYEYKQSRYRERILCTQAARDHLDKEVEIRLHPYLPWYPQTEVLGQQTPFREGLYGAYSPAFFLLLCGYLWRTYVRDPLRRRRLVESGTPFCATVAQKYQDDSEPKEYIAEYTYNVGDACTVFTGKQILTLPQWEALEIGEQFTGLHDAANPETVLLYALSEWEAVPQ